MKQDTQRLRRLYILAQEDAVYQMWKHSYEEWVEDFEAFANAQPEEIRNFLYGYADNGRIMMQRMVNLACKYMKFPDEV
jgi:nucleoid-associated protein YejK